MKKLLKILGIILGVVILLLLIGAATIHFGGIPSYEVSAPDLKVLADSTMIAEGKRISAMICSNCHMANNGKLEGQAMADLPAEFGKAWTANITPYIHGF